MNVWFDDHAVEDAVMAFTHAHKCVGNFQREYVMATWSDKDNGSSSKVVLIEFSSL